MKRFSIFFSLYLLLITLCNIHAWSPILPDIQNRGTLHLRKGEEFFEMGMDRKAICEFNLAYKFSFNKRERNNILIKKVISFIKLEDFEEAIESIEKREFEDSREDEFLYLKAECLQKLNRTVEALRIFDTLISQEKNRRNRNFFELKEALIFLSLDSLSKAEETLLNVSKDVGLKREEMDSLDKQKLELTMYSLGYIAFTKGDYENAERYFDFLFRNFPYEKAGYKSSLYLRLIGSIKGKEKGEFNASEFYNIRESGEISAMKGYIFYKRGFFKQTKAEFQSIENYTFLSKEIKEMITILLAECSYMLKDYGDAVRYYRQYNDMVNKPYQKMPALYGLAWSYFKMGKYSNTYAVLKDFVVLYPETPYLATIEKLSALSLFYVGEHKEAKFHFTRLLNLEKRDRDRIYYLRGKSEFYLHEFEKAELDFQRITSHFPQSRWKPNAMDMLARINFEKEEYLDAYNRYKTLLEMELSPSLLDAVRFQTERCLLHLGYYRNPIEMSTAFVRKYPQSPKSPELQLEIAEYYFQLQKYWEAIREYDRFIGLFPGDKSYRFALYKLGRSYSQIGYEEKALDIYKELSSGVDEYAESVLVSMGDLLFRKERYKESIEVFKELTGRFPESDMKNYANFIIGKNYLELNLPKEARVSFELVVKSKGRFRFKEKAELLIAKTFYMEGKGEKYLEYLDNLINSGFLRLRADAYFLKAQYKRETGRFKQAMELFKKASVTYSEKAERVRALYEAGLSAEELMLFDEAIEFYKEALIISQIESTKLGIDVRIKRIDAIKGKNH